MSPDGFLLAYRHRPDSFFEGSPHYVGAACGGGAEQVEAWWEGSKEVAAKIVVMETVSGETKWQLEVPADATMSDFDGRYIVVARGGRSVIYDTTGELPPVDVLGSVILMRPSSSWAERVPLRGS